MISDVLANRSSRSPDLTQEILRSLYKTVKLFSFKLLSNKSLSLQIISPQLNYEITGFPLPPRNPRPAPTQTGSYAELLETIKNLSLQNNNC